MPEVAQLWVAWLRSQPGQMDFRRHDGFGGLHHWTADANEVNYLTGSQGWVSEGIAGYVIPLH